MGRQKGSSGDETHVSLLSCDLDAVDHHAPAPDDLPGYYHPAHYPMWLISVPELLALDRMRPHQALLRAGKLVQWRQPSRGGGGGRGSWAGGGVIFVSHQWLGFREPDPNGEQLRDLQGILRRLMSGDVGRVGPNWKLKLVLGDKSGVSASEWREALPGMLVWVDYFSIPQPFAGPMPPVRGSCDPGPAAGGVDAGDSSADGTVSNSNGAPRRRQDPRERRGARRRSLPCVPGEDAVLEELLVRAVRSIPAYIERCSLMVVLAPTAWHRDAGEVCDYSSWRRRGWCRMELACALLSPVPSRVLLVRGRDATPEFVSPVDSLFLTAPLGRFTFPEDAVAVAEVVRSMLDGKEEACRKIKGDDGVFQRRFFVCIRHWFVKGPGARGAPDGGNGRGDEEENDAAAVAALRSRLEWADDATERRREKRAGISLIFWAALDDNLPALRALLSAKSSSGRGDGQSGNDGPPRRFPRRRRRPRRAVDQRTKRGIAGMLMAGTTPLIVAMSFARFDVAEALLDAGAGPKRMDGVGLDPLMWACALGRVDNVARWLERFPSWDLERRDRVAGNTALGVTVSQGGDKLPVVRVLLDAGADAGVRPWTGQSVLCMNALSADADAGLLAYFLDARPELVRVDDRVLSPSALWRAIMRLSELAVRAGSSDPFFRYVSSWRGGTALHMAASSGSVAAAGLLVARGADSTVRNAQRQTPMDIARFTFGTVPPLLGRALTKTTPAEEPCRAEVGANGGDNPRRQITGAPLNGAKFQNLEVIDVPCRRKEAVSCQRPDEGIGRANERLQGPRPGSAGVAHAPPGVQPQQSRGEF